MLFGRLPEESYADDSEKLLDGAIKRATFNPTIYKMSVRLVL